jgi:hypothetical protein
LSSVDETQPIAGVCIPELNAVSWIRCADATVCDEIVAFYRTFEPNEARRAAGNFVDTNLRCNSLNGSSLNGSSLPPFRRSHFVDPNFF